MKHAIKEVRACFLSRCDKAVYCKDNYLLHGTYTQHMVHNVVNMDIKYGWHTPNK